ncbi:MAG: hypothetical protein QF489_00115 [Planctomycetota bacterium]|nr:hypothetical protein [Planctomycetota bacterium]
MATPTPHPTSDSPFSERERQAKRIFRERLEASTHPDRDRFQQIFETHLTRTAAIQKALRVYPPVLQENKLGSRERGLGTLVELLANATDADFEMFLPMRAMLWRSLTMSRLNFWRLLRYLSEEIEPDDTELATIIDRRVHACVYLKLVDELLTSLAMDEEIPRNLRQEVVASMTSLWDSTPSKAVQQFFPLLEAVWEARRKLFVSVGTMLGVSEIMKLLQAGCAPQFVDYFSRAHMSNDEGSAFQEFLIGVTTEQITDLQSFMKGSGRTCLSPEEAKKALGLDRTTNENYSIGVQAYQFHRERHLQSAARRLRSLPGPKHTAEEYMLMYFLEDFVDAPHDEESPADAHA